MKIFVNKKGERKFISEKDYISSVIMMLNKKGFKELFTNTGDNSE